MAGEANTVKLTPQLRMRLHTACRTIAARTAISTLGWADDQMLSALSLINTGLSAQDAAAVVRGDAVLEDGRVDYDPGCAWIDFMLTRRSRTLAECERIIAQAEAMQGQDMRQAVAANVVSFAAPRRAGRQMAAAGR